MKEIKVTVQNPNGLHLRVASEVVKICKKRNAKINLTCDNCPHADGCSVISLLMLGAARGTPVTIQAEGEEEKQVLEDLKQLFSDGTGIEEVTNMISKRMCRQNR